MSTTAQTGSGPYTFRHAPGVWARFPTLVSLAACAHGVVSSVDVSAKVAAYHEVALSRLEKGTESDLPSIRSWRRAFSQMGLRPTQYRCAAEALLRRLRKEGSLPSLHPLIDLCNALSAAFAIPVAVLDLAGVKGDLTVRPGDGTEVYATFDGRLEHPEPVEIVFADSAGTAHSRRWCNRQGAASAVRQDTSEVLVVAEALHPEATADITSLRDALSSDLGELWGAVPPTRILSAEAPALALDAWSVDGVEAGHRQRA
ncbi:phenylalanine--tRNA ligase beta subunit-related protein [Streptomyces sp. NPDC093707]|uniref:B3/B4 domain-containing protein n=1 Tax=Streptomyces sp. NPDC093707 TaxID=3154984 RepID=UPI00344DE64E